MFCAGVSDAVRNAVAVSQKGAAEARWTRRPLVTDADPQLVVVDGRESDGISQWSPKWIILMG